MLETEKFEQAKVIYLVKSRLHLPTFAIYRMYLMPDLDMLIITMFSMNETTEIHLSLSLMRAVRVPVQHPPPQESAVMG